MNDSSGSLNHGPALRGMARDVQRGLLARHQKPTMPGTPLTVGSLRTDRSVLCLSVD